MARLFFLHPSEIQGQFIHFSERTEKHLISLRKRTGDEITAVLNTPELKRSYLIRLIQQGRHYVGEIIKEDKLELPDQPKIHILQCIPKIDKMDLIIQKASELGVYEIVPLFSKFTDIRDKVGDKKLTRWQNIAEEGSIQSGRKDVISISTPQELSSYLKQMSPKQDDIRLILNEMETERTLHTIEGIIRSGNLRDIFVLIGAEGGLAKEEVEQAQEAGFLSITLGERILRTETAPIAIASILQYLLGGM